MTFGGLKTSPGSYKFPSGFCSYCLLCPPGSSCHIYYLATTPLSVYKKRGKWRQEKNEEVEEEMETDPPLQNMWEQSKLSRRFAVTGERRTQVILRALSSSALIPFFPSPVSPTPGTLHLPSCIIQSTGTPGSHSQTPQIKPVQDSSDKVPSTEQDGGISPRLAAAIHSNTCLVPYR